MATKQSALHRILRPFEVNVPAELARQILAMSFADVALQRYKELSEKAQLGNLTTDEDAELDDFLTASDVLMILQSKARIALTNKPAA